jgi:quercetin dioxygenase-like cupin family protein
MLTMKNILSNGLVVVALVLAACATSNAQIPDKAPQTTAGDPAVVAKDVYKLILDNPRVRVFDVRFAPGQRAEMHSHPDHVVYVFDDASLRLTGGDGKSQDITVKAGQSIFIPAGPHAAENIGPRPAHNLVVELKSGG